MKSIFFLHLLVYFIACDDKIGTSHQPNGYKTPDTAMHTNPDRQEGPDDDITGCYMKIVGRDTAVLMLEQKGNMYAGKLLYDNFEKDGSRGIISGKEDKDILKLWYHYTSEGMRSVMEVYFKKENGRLLRGVGDMDVRTDTTYFISGINYSEKEAFNKVDCNLIGWKLKF